MAQPTDATKLGKSFFHAFSKTQTESTQYVFESLYKSAHSTRGSDVWADTVPYAIDVTAADNNATAYPSRIKKYTLTSLTEIPGSNGQAWYINDGGKFVRPWIAPTDIPNPTTNDPSYGYQARLYKSDNSQVMPASGVWMIDYYAGLILFEIGSTPADLGYGIPKTTCYSYIGATLTSTGTSGGGMTLDITQANSFVQGDAIYLSSTGIWTLARANNENTLGVALVSSPTPTSFTAIFGGPITGLTGKIAGQYYFVSDTVAGTLITTEPGTFSNPLLLATTSTGGVVVPFRPSTAGILTVVLPELTTAQRIALTPFAISGSLVIDIDLEKMFRKRGSIWVEV